MKLLSAFAVATVSLSTSINAQTERDLGSHEHGSASLNIAVENNSVFIELDSPWNNLVGFEHDPSTSEQKAMVDDALGQLNQPDQLFSFIGSECTATETAIESSLGSDHDDEHHDDHDGEDHHDEDKDHEGEEHHDHDDDKDHEGEEHHDHDDDKDHEGEDHDDHDDDKDHDSEGHHDDEHADEDTHSSVLVSYSFNCSNGGQLDAIDVELLKIWSGFEELDVQLIGPGGQAAQEITAQQARLDIRAIQ